MSYSFYISILRKKPMSAIKWLELEYEEPWEMIKEFHYGYYPEGDMDCMRKLADFLSAWPTNYHWYLTTPDNARLRWSEKKQAWSNYALGSHWSSQKPIVIELE